MPNFPAPFMQPYDFGTTRCVFTSTDITKPGALTIVGLQSISDIGFSVDSTIVRGTGNRRYGQTPGVMTPNDVSFEVLLPQWDSITAMFGYTELVSGWKHLNIQVVHKMPGIAVKNVIGHSLMDCKMISASAGVAQGADALTVSFTVRPLDIVDLSALSVLAGVIRANI